MVAVKPSGVERALRERSPATRAYLIYGPDSGLVAERARKLAESSVADPGDPFQLVRMEGDGLASDPARLADETGTMALFGGSRTIWVKPTSRNIAAAVSASLEGSWADGTLVVLEAGDLAKSAPLRALCERSPHALAIPCYADTAQDLAALVDTVLGEAELSIEPDARAMLLASLGGDRLASRGELTKLALYARGKGRVTFEDIEAVISDVAWLGSDQAIDAAFMGDGRGADTAWRRLAANGVAAPQLLALVQRHAQALLGVVASLDSGQSADAALASWRGLHFRRKPEVQRQLRLWTTSRLAAALDRIQAAVLETRRLPNLSDAIASRALLEIARSARR